ncbi:MAG: AAA family ATPase, partial [Ardenticatenales bacterium]|nr:AAA family ATPase [Ardenticatenales bacterium]
MSSLLETLVSYVPAPVVRRLATNPIPITAPIAERFSAAVLFADISGFTRLSERLAQRGPAGAEALTQVLNDYFGRLITLVTEHGGEIVKFAGDSLLALWPTADETGARQALRLRSATHRAAQCALAIQATLHDYRAAEGVLLSLRVALGAGEVFTAHIGGVHGRWEFLVTGTPLVQVASAERETKPGKVVLSAEAWVMMSKHAKAHPLSNGNMQLETIFDPLSIIPAALPPLSPEMENPLRAYLPGVVLARLAAGQSSWLAELRRVTILFINFPDLTYETPLAEAQQLIRTLQSILYRYEGSVNKITVDDKGVTMVAAFGLPPLAHEDDVIRGVQAALSVQEALHEWGTRTAIGVTSGRAFCGSVGSPTRREYTMIGDVVNLAARLMQAAPNDILCDATTYHGASAQVVFEILAPITVKGKSEPIPIYRPSLKTPTLRIHRPEAQSAQNKAEMVGRMAERAQVSEEIQALLRGGEGGIIIVEGEAGIGKSRLVEDILQKSQAVGVASLLGAADAIEQSTPYHAWRAIFSQVLDLEMLADLETRRRHVLEQVAEDADLLRLAPLLNTVLALDLPENEVTEQMTGQVRADNTRDILLKLLQISVNQSPKLLILEDSHWLDSASWALAGLVAQRIHPLLLVIVTRPLTDPLPVEYSQLVRTPGMHRIILDSLSVEEALALVCRRLSVGSLPEPVATLIGERAEGHPFFSEELAYALRDAGLIVITDGECRMAPGAGDLRALDFPDTVQGVITSRIDRLTASQQLTLKVASVIGRVFSFKTLQEVHPIEADKPHLTDYINALARLDITPMEIPEPELTYIFKHIITQEVAYNMMLFSQRRELHRAVAEWAEQNYQDDLTPYYPLLAHHWGKANVAVKTLHYLIKAGEQALHNYANEEAVTFFSAALALDAQAEKASDKLQRAYWELQLGKAYVNWVRFTEGRVHLERGLALLGEGVPTNKLSLVGSLLGQTLVQVQHRFQPSRYVGRRAEEQLTLLEASRAYEGLATVYYFINDTLLTLYAAIRSLNLAEAAGPSSELARGYATMGTIVGFIPLHGMAASYCQWALDGVQDSSNLPARAWVSLLTGIYYSGVGDWARGDSLFNQVIDISTHLGDRARWDDGVGNLALAHYFQGNFERALSLSEQFYHSSCRRNDAHNTGWALRQRIYSLLLFNRLDEAMSCVEEWHVVLQHETGGVVDEPLKIDYHALHALLLWRRGEQEQAARVARAALNLLAKTPPTSYLSLPGYAAVAEIFLSLWASGGVVEGSTSKAEAKRALKAMDGYARVFPIGRART